MKIIYLALIGMLSSCQPNTEHKPGAGLTNRNDNEQEPNAEFKDDRIAEKAENRSHRQILCQDGLAAANSPGQDDFTRIFEVICKDGETTQAFEDTLATAYKGEGEPELTIIESETDEMYVTKLAFMYALEIPKASPAYFADLKIYERLDGQGIESDNSKLVTSVESREAFTGKGSVEKVTLQHQLQVAEGAALFDKRRTEINNYLIVESTRDVTLSTEHLLDEGNEHYEVARGVLVGIQAPERGTSYLLYVNEFVVKNRIDPKRLVDTVLNLSRQNQKIIYQVTLEN